MAIGVNSLYRAPVKVFVMTSLDNQLVLVSADSDLSTTLIYNFIRLSGDVGQW